MDSPTADAVIDFTQGFEGKVLDPVPVAAAARRILAYCTEPRSGWVTYDLAGLQARQLGILDHVGAWSLLYANALNGQVTLDNVAAFDRTRRRDFASRLARIPANTDLHEMNDDNVEAVVDACHFGFHGVWGPKITKLGALYRPKSIPVLDGHVAEAFGFDREGFTGAALQRGMTRRERIEKVVRALASALKVHRGEIVALRRSITPAIPEITQIPDLRLIDMVIWTAQDDQVERRVRQGARWLDRLIGQHVPLGDLRPEPINSDPPWGDATNG